MKLNIFSKNSKDKQIAPLDAISTAPTDDDTVITNFTESFLEAYFDGELQASEEKQLEGVLGMRYVQEEMLKRGKLRNIISRESVLSIPSSHDLMQEKKRVWNEIEHELKSHLSSPLKGISSPKEPAFKFNLRDSILRSLAAGSAFMVVGLVYLGVSSNGEMASEPTRLEPISMRLAQEDFVLNHPREMKEIIRLVRDDASRNNSRSAGLEPVGARELREFESHNHLIASLNTEELSDLGSTIIRNQDLDSSMLTFVSNQRTYE